eukprot:scaffold15805_cov34-Phaeocystis_antarctica.AAC.1
MSRRTERLAKGARLCRVGADVVGSVYDTRSLSPPLSKYTLGFHPLKSLLISEHGDTAHSPPLSDLDKGSPLQQATSSGTALSPPYALTPSKAALSTTLTQVLPRCTLKLPAQAHWPHWQRSRCLKWHAAHRVDDGVVDFGLFSCISCLAAWEEPITPGLQQPPAALWRGRSLARAQLQHPEHA